MFDTRKQTALSDAVAPQLVGHDHPRRVLQALQQPSEEAVGGIGISPLLNKDIKHNAVLVDGAPEVVLNTLDPDEHLVEVPLVPRPWSAATNATGKTLAEFPTPAAHRLVGDGNAPLGQEQLNMPQTEAEHVIQPHSMADKLGGKAMAIVRVGRRFHIASLVRPQRDRQTRLPMGWTPPDGIDVPTWRC